MRLNKIRLYLGVTFLYTWLLWLPILLNYQFNMNLWVWPGQFYYGSFGPLAGALISTCYFDGIKGLKAWLIRTFNFRSSAKGLLESLITICIYAFIGLVAHRIILQEWPVFSQFGQTSKLLGLSTTETLLVWILTFGLGEESGWRGFLLVELRHQYDFRTSAMMVGGIWILWHLPAFAFNSTYQQMGFALFGWLLSVLFGSVVLSWMSEKNQFNILPVILWHAGFDLLTASDQAQDVMAMVCSMLVILQAIYILRFLVHRHEQFHRRIG